MPPVAPVTTPYKHFASKQALLAAIAARELARQREALAETIQREPSPAAVLREAMHRYVAWALEYPARFKLTFGNWTIDSQELGEAAHDVLTMLVEIVAAAQDAGALPRATPSAWHHCYRSSTRSSATCSTTSRTPRRRPRNNQSSVRLARLDGLLQDLVARPRLRGDGAEPSGLVVLERPQQLLAGVHHEGTVGGDRLADRQAAEHQHVELWAAALLAGIRADGHHVTGAVDGELAHAHGPALGTD